MSKVRLSSRVNANTLGFCRWSEQRPHGWWEMSYWRVIWTNRSWVPGLRSAPVRTERWSVKTQGNVPPYRQSLLILPLCKSFLLIFCPQGKCKMACTFLTSPILVSPALSSQSHSLFLPSTHFPLCVASHPSGCWIIDGMLGWWDFSCCGLVCWSGCVCVIVSFSIMLCMCVCVCM